jgi:hypothetical protein
MTIIQPPERLPGHNTIIKASFMNATIAAQNPLKIKASPAKPARIGSVQRKPTSGYRIRKELSLKIDGLFDSEPGIASRVLKYTHPKAEKREHLMRFQLQ